MIHCISSFVDYSIYYAFATLALLDRDLIIETCDMQHAHMKSMQQPGKVDSICYKWSTPWEIDGKTYEAPILWRCNRSHHALNNDRDKLVATVYSRGCRHMILI